MSELHISHKIQEIKQNNSNKLLLLYYVTIRLRKSLHCIKIDHIPQTKSLSTVLEYGQSL